MTPQADRHERIIVIGGGLGGLASACVLAARGYRVTLLERNTWAGGKAAVLHGDAPCGGTFRFDMGPTILTMPHVLGRIFAEAGRDMHDELDLVRLDPQWRCFFDDGSVLDLREDVEAMKEELRRLPLQRQYDGQLDDVARREQAALPGQYERFIERAARLHDISERFFFWKPIGGLRDMFDFSSTVNAGTLSDVAAMKMGRSVARVIRGDVHDPRVAQMLDHFTQYVGSSPFNSPAVLCGIASMQVKEGVWYPRGGTRAVPQALQRLAEQLGVEFHLGEGVKRLVIRNSAVQGIITDSGQILPCAAVVSNMDSVRTHRELVGEPLANAFERSYAAEPACSGVVLYLGLRQRYEHLAHHDFVFSRDPHEEFRSIYEMARPAPDPTCYIAAPAATDQDVAPPGGEALYVLVHTPFLRPWHDWKAMLPEYRQVILDKLKRTGGMEDIEERIVFESALTPQDIHERYHVLNGAIYGLASHGLWTGAFKPSNRSPHVKGLYLAGGAAHPGPGMPMVLMSGWIAADALDGDGLVERAAASTAAAGLE